VGAAASSDADATAAGVAGGAASAMDASTIAAGSVVAADDDIRWAARALHEKKATHSVTNHTKTRDIEARET